MWLLINDKLNDEFFLLQIGKALCLCQKFESTCKEIIMWFETMKSLKEKKYDFLDNKYKDNVDKLLNLLLVKSINLLRKNSLLKITSFYLRLMKEAMLRQLPTLRKYCSEPSRLSPKPLAKNI